MPSPKAKPPTALIVAAAGRGTRLERVSAGSPKPFVEVSGRPILSWALSAFESSHLTALALVVPPGWMTTALEIATLALPDIPRAAIEQESPEGTLDALELGLRALVQEDLQEHRDEKAAVLFLHGDNIPASGAGVQALNRLAGSDAIIISRTADRLGYGARVLRDETGRATAVLKDAIGSPGGELEISTGLFAYGAWIWSGLEGMTEGLDHPTGERRIDDFNAALLAAGRAVVVPIEGPWMHINTAEDLADAERVLARLD